MNDGLRINNHIHCLKRTTGVETTGYDPVPLVFQTSASTKLASSPWGLYRYRTDFS